MKAVAYARFSSENQREESIAAQLRAIREYARKHNIEIVKEYIDEARSATTDDRPGFLHMIADLKNGLKVDLVLVHKLDRFARNRYDAAVYRREIQKAGARLLAVDQPLDDSPEAVLLESLLEGLAEYYSRNLAREVMKGLKENAYQAKHNGGIPPLGYDVVDGQYVINEREAAIVRLIFRRVLEGKSYGAIIEELNRLGFCTKKGQPFGKNSIHDLLRNPRYYGTYVYMKGSKKAHRGMREDAIVIENAIPAIVSKEEWLKVQEILDKRKAGTGNRSKVDYYLTGSVYCGLCGSAYVGNSGSGKSRKKYYYYHCNQAMRKKNCPARPIRKEALEEAVCRVIKDKVFSPQYKELLAEKVVHYSNAKLEEELSLRETLERKLAECIAKADKLVDRLVETESKLEQSRIRERLKELDKQKDAIEAELARLNRRPTVTKEMVLAYFDHLEKELEEHGHDVKVLVQRLVKKITVCGEEIEIELNASPSDGGVLIKVVALHRYRDHQNTVKLISIEVI